MWTVLFAIVRTGQERPSRATSMAISAPPEPTGTAPTRTLFGLTDAELVAAVRRGSDRAFEQLYARYHRRIAAYVHGMVGDHGRAEDIAQEVFISALRRMRETERPIAFKPWIYEIAKNACIDQFRRARRSEEVSIDADDGLGAADYGRLAGSGPAPDVAVDQKMAIDHLRGAFGGLSETHHEILVMRELEGLSYAEIGDRLGMTRPSVESTLFRARRRLGEEYEELVSGVRCLRVQDIIDAAGAALPGARDQRRLSAHLSHCQPCRRHARVAGLDATLLVTAPRRVRTRIAALLPLPAFLRRRWVEEDVTPAVANHHVSSVAQLSAQLSTAVDPAIASWAKAVAAAATLALAGAAGGAA
ncbi:MAG: sigma-70 family polymerase sigma factor, partial [Solirubrobacterales bacterium]|nr:sigma-70 family polymerase sigma factor [Solirubrobacterales bacterium]